ncbi:alanine--tRNA ligase, partial [Nitrospirota bacterium]
MWVTVFRDDDDAEQLWKKIGVSPARIMRCGETDNFWQMGDTGP